MLSSATVYILLIKDKDITEIFIFVCKVYRRFFIITGIKHSQVVLCTVLCKSLVFLIFI